MRGIHLNHPGSGLMPIGSPPLCGEYTAHIWSQWESVRDHPRYAGNTHSEIPINKGGDQSPSLNFL